MIDSIVMGNHGWQIKESMDKLLVWLGCNAIKGLGQSQKPALVRNLLNESRLSMALLQYMGLTLLQSEQFFAVKAKLALIHRWLACPHHHILTLDSDQYPSQLAECADKPLILYVKGDIRCLTYPQIAIVGSRDCSYYGRHWAEYFAQSLSASGVTVTSGLAYGIDGVAHRATLKEESPTIAVLGSGLERIYPQQHTGLAAKIVSNGGALVSEFSLHTPPLARHFPQRNRIISGLSYGVLVIEATLKSGSLITTRYALEQNRTIYALPGSLGKPESEGCHWLIRQGAVLVTEVEDVLIDLQNCYPNHFFTVKKEIISTDEPSAALPFASVLANVGDEVTSVDVVAERCNQPLAVIYAALIELELAGLVVTVPGGYVRIRRTGHVRRTDLLV